jgi:hypothetical protein
MKERPILFSGPMVRAIMAGTKTQTRRAVKRFALEWLTMQNGFNANFVALPENNLSPYGYAGDRLWVRETWARDDEDGALFYRADVGLGGDADDWERNRLDGAPRYRWRPSIHIPRRASRTTLDVTALRIERLQDISEADALAEGIVPARDGSGFQLADTTHYSGNPIDSYFSLWEHINGPGSVEANPWVWVVEWPALLNTISTNTQT